MKVPMQSQKVQSRQKSAPNPARAELRASRVLAPVYPTLQIGITQLEQNLKLTLEHRPFLAIPFMLAVLLFILLLGFLSPLLMPSRDFHFSSPLLSFPQDVGLPRFLLNNADLETALQQPLIEVPPPEQNLAKDLTPVLQTQTYQIKPGDMISVVANHFNVSLGTLISFNNIHNVRRVSVGTVLVVPNSDGVLYTVQTGDSLSGIARNYKIPYETILEANQLSSPVVTPNQKIFLPGATISNWELRQALGELFLYPTRGYITSRFGYRRDPFTGVRTYHNGVDLANSIGTAVRAAMEGRVTDTGFNSSYGNYIILSHEGGFQTLYGHLKAIKVSVGQAVAQSQLIGLMGNTGYSTGPHLHFSIFLGNRAKNPLDYLF